ncbi:MAG: acyltransferase family protein [Clostridiales bacterium]|nr:acyltransferase family protein [Clostridiales bacterium]
MSEERRPDGRVFYFDLLRVLSILAVIVTHASWRKFHVLPVGTPEWNLLNAVQALCRFAVPVLLMISGAFMLDERRDYPPKKLFQKILRLVAALAFWSTLYAVYTTCAGHRPVDAAFFAKLVKTAVRGHYHLWFLYMIVGLYIASPILRAICKSRRAAEYFLALWFAFELGLNLLAIPNRLAPWVSWFRGALMPYTVMGYAGYFILGHYLVSYPVPRRAVRAIYVLGAFSLAVSVVGTHLLSVKKGGLTEALHYRALPTTALYAASVFLFAMRRYRDRIPSERAVRAFGMISKLSFGAYLVHDFSLILFHHLGFEALGIHPALYAPLFSIMAIALSFGASYCLSKIPFLNRYIL